MKQKPLSKPVLKTSLKKHSKSPLKKRFFPNTLEKKQKNNLTLQNSKKPWKKTSKHLKTQKKNFINSLKHFKTHPFPRFALHRPSDVSPACRSARRRGTAKSCRRSSSKLEASKRPSSWQNVPGWGFKVLVGCSQLYLFNIVFPPFSQSCSWYRTWNLRLKRKNDYFTSTFCFLTNMGHVSF